eukprot:TRINITY_DN854_c0_g1_i1.p1 TRINITY_DN854_c0_g1~~TRINITY_DN854_c0_g1_i1.p1  ORF type:complete len:403 (+),score=34.72 TRINITY_DN854_c0_g1_i1:65-1210(+)
MPINFLLVRACRTVGVLLFLGCSSNTLVAGLDGCCKDAFSVANDGTILFTVHGNGTVGIPGRLDASDVQADSVFTKGRIGIGGTLTVAGITTFTSPATSSSATTGALVVTGGVGIGGALNVAGITTFTSPAPSSSTTTGALVVTGGVGIGGALNVAGITTFTSPAPSSSTTTGALVVTGGVGIGGALNVAGITMFTSPTSSSSATTGAVVVTGGVGVGGGLNVAGITTFTSPATSSSPTTGALVVTGGVGIGGALNVAGKLSANGGLIFAGNVTFSGPASFRTGCPAGWNATRGFCYVYGRIGDGIDAQTFCVDYGAEPCSVGQYIRIRPSECTVPSTGWCWTNGVHSNSVVAIRVDYWWSTSVVTDGPFPFYCCINRIYG